MGRSKRKTLLAFGMKNMSNQWFKFYGGDYLNSATIARLTASERSCWVTLLCFASIKNNKIEFLDEETLMLKSGIQKGTAEWDATLGVLQKFQNFKMINIDVDLMWINNFDVRQETAMTATERSRRFREKQRENQEMQRNATQRNENATLEENRIEENRIDISNNKPEKRETKKARLNSGYEFKFESFWNAYPNKVAKGKAYEVFTLLSEEIQTECVNAINKQVENNHFWKDWLNDGKGGDNPPHPTTWLNQKRWEDGVVFIKREGKIKNQPTTGIKKYG